MAFSFPTGLIPALFRRAQQDFRHHEPAATSQPIGGLVQEAFADAEMKRRRFDAQYVIEALCQKQGSSVASK
jgi:hypothetical protein